MLALFLAATVEDVLEIRPATRKMLSEVLHVRLHDVYKIRQSPVAYSPTEHIVLTSTLPLFQEVL